MREKRFRNSQIYNFCIYKKKKNSSKAQFFIQRTYHEKMKRLTNVECRQNPLVICETECEKEPVRAQALLNPKKRLDCIQKVLDK